MPAAPGPLSDARRPKADRAPLPSRLLLPLVAQVFLALLLLPGLCFAGEETVELRTGSPDFFAQATSDGVPADFLSSRSVAARIVQYNRPLVDMLSESEGGLVYQPLRNGHSLRRRLYSPAEGRVVDVEYRFVYHPETKEAELTDILVDGRILDNYDFYDYADELCRPKRP